MVRAEGGAPRLGAALFALAALAGSTAAPAMTQPLRGVNDSTEVGSLRFRFADGSSFSESRLRDRMATSAPGFWGRLQNRLAFLPLVPRIRAPFDPVELQRDMVRLRAFYRDNGFVSPLIDYPASRFDPSRNRMDLIVTIREGPPLVVGSRSARFVTPLDPALDRAWGDLEERLALRPGDRYTEFSRVQLESRLRSWMADRGYAFARADVRALVDSSMFRVDLDLALDPGVRARIDRVLVEGVETVSERVITRQLPFAPGDLFRADALVEGQRSLFGLNLFRVALADLPDQPADSTVTVRIRVRESPKRLFTAGGGYSRENGLEVGGSLRHRSFLGAARQLSLSGTAVSGWLASSGSDRKPVRSADVSLSLRQPYLFERRVSGSGTLFARWVDDPNQVVRYRETGISPSILFQYLPFRAAQVQYSLSRAVPLGGMQDLTRIDVFDRSAVSLSFAMGRLNNYLHPRRGWMVRPGIEQAGLFLGGGVAYRRLAVDATGLIPITMESSVIVSVTAGRLFPGGASRDQADPQVEYRFDPIRFYAGGSADVRGWSLNALGPKWVHADTVYVASDGTPTSENAAYESAGGLGKLSFRTEYRFPAPGLGDAWRLGVFADAGGVSARVRRDAKGRALPAAAGLVVVDDRAFPAVRDLKVGAGFGLRYLTPVGAVRLDLAWKVNPDALDLQRPGDRALYEAGLLAEEPERLRLRRFALHLSIDRAF